MAGHDGLMRYNDAVVRLAYDSHFDPLGLGYEQTPRRKRARRVIRFKALRKTSNTDVRTQLVF